MKIKMQYQQLTVFFVIIYISFCTGSNLKESNALNFDPKNDPVQDKMKEFAGQFGFQMKRQPTETKESSGLLENLARFRNFTPSLLREELKNIYQLRNDYTNIHKQGIEGRAFAKYYDSKCENKAQLLREILYHHLMYEKYINRLRLNDEDNVHGISQINAQKLCEGVDTVGDFPEGLKQRCEEYSFCKFEEVDKYADSYKCVFDKKEYNSMKTLYKVLRKVDSMEYYRKESTYVGLEALEMMTVKVPLFKNVQIDIYQTKENTLAKTYTFGSDTRTAKLHLWYNHYENPTDANQSPNNFDVLLPNPQPVTTSKYKQGDIVHVKHNETDAWKHGMVIYDAPVIVIGIYYEGLSELHKWNYIREIYDYQPGKYVTKAEFTGICSDWRLYRGTKDVIENVGPNTELNLRIIIGINEQYRIRGQIGDGKFKGKWVSIYNLKQNEGWMQPKDPLAEIYNIGDVVICKQNEKDDWMLGNVVSLFPIIFIATDMGMLPLCAFKYFQTPDQNLRNEFKPPIDGQIDDVIQHASLQFTGRWTASDGDIHEIFSETNQIQWSDGGTDSVTFPSPTEIKVMLEGTEYTGVLERIDNRKIHIIWSDNDIWVKKNEFKPPIDEQIDDVIQDDNLSTQEQDADSDNENDEFKPQIDDEIQVIKPFNDDRFSVDDILHVIYVGEDGIAVKSLEQFQLPMVEKWIYPEEFHKIELLEAEVKVGSRVEIVAAFDDERFKVGDILQVTEVQDYILITVRYENDNSNFVIFSTEYNKIELLRPSYGKRKRDHDEKVENDKNISK